MGSFASAPVLKIIIPFIGGIAIWQSIPTELPFATGIFFVVGVLFIVSVLVLRKRLFAKFNYLIALLCFSAYFTAGFSISSLFDQSEQSAPFLQPQKIDAFIAKVRSGMVHKGNHQRCIIRIEGIHSEGRWEKTNCKGYLYLSISDQVSDISYGQKLLILGQPELISPPKNPNEFDYRKYLKFKNIFLRDFATKKNILAISEPHKGIYSMLLNLKEKVRNIIIQNIPSPNSQAIAMALLLGDRHEMNEDIRHAYAAAGASHVLAVSGLHVGIIFLLFNYTLGFLKRRHHIRWLFYLISLTAIWGYAALTGFSPSVSRASIMFSFFLVADFLRISSNSYNTLGSSALIILLFNPFVLFSLSFQLSYLAVLGILFLYPKLYSLIQVDNQFTNYVWKLMCLSVAAQALTFPLIVYTFHDFPLLFLLTNIMVVPAAAIMIIAGLTFISLSVIPGVANVLGALLSSFIDLINTLIVGTAKIPFSNLHDLSLSGWQLFCVYSIIISVLIFQSSKKWLSYYSALAAAFLLFTVTVMNTYQSFVQQKVVFYSVPRGLSVDFIKGHKAVNYTHPRLDSAQIDYLIKPNRIENKINKVETYQEILFRDESINGMTPVIFGDHSFAILTKNPSIPVNEVFEQADYLILNCDPVLVLEKIQLKKYDGNIIVDTRGNYKKWKTHLTKFNNTDANIHLLRDGALTLDLH